MENFDIKKQTLCNVGEYNYLLRDGVDKFLSDFCKQNKPKSVLEIGTAFGYSAYVLLSSCDCKLISVEKDQTKVSVAKQNLQNAGFENRFQILCGDAGELITTLDQKFDLIFLDGPKGQYIKYLPILKTLLNPNGALIADNVYFQGKVLAQGFVPHKHRTIVVNLRKFLQEISDDPDFQTQVLDIGDGISVSPLKGVSKK